MCTRCGTFYMTHGPIEGRSLGSCRLQRYRVKKMSQHMRFSHIFPYSVGFPRSCPTCRPGRCAGQSRCPPRLAASAAASAPQHFPAFVCSGRQCRWRSRRRRCLSRHRRRQVSYLIMSRTYDHAARVAREFKL